MHGYRYVYPAQSAFRPSKFKFGVCGHSLQLMPLATGASTNEATS